MVSNEEKIKGSQFHYIMKFILSVEKLRSNFITKFENAHDFDPKVIHAMDIAATDFFQKLQDNSLIGALAWDSVAKELEEKEESKQQ